MASLSLKNINKKFLPKTLPFITTAGANDVNGDEMSYDSYLKTGLTKTTKRASFDNGQIFYETLDDQPVLVVSIGHQKIAETEEEKERQDKWLAFVNNAIVAEPDRMVILLVNGRRRYDDEDDKRNSE